MLSVLVVDDSASVRAVLRRFLARDPELRVIGEAADGEAAVEGVLRLRPDVLLLDLAMPKLDGFGVLAALAGRAPVPTVILTSRADRAEVRAAFEALRAGAVELLPKPEDPESWRHLADTLPAVLRAAARSARPTAPAAPPAPAAPAARPAPAPPRGPEVGGLPPLRPSLPAPAARSGPWRWLALGASTGGPAAVHDLLAALGPACPARILLVQHIARGFEGGLADWLASSLGLDVRVAIDGERPVPGTVRIAPGDFHLRLAADERLALDGATAPRRGHRPSVDELFHSLAALAPRETAAVLLTGMGADGAEGLAALRRAGAFCAAQDEASSAVYGMPKVARELGGVELALPPHALGEELARRFGSPG